MKKIISFALIILTINIKAQDQRCFNKGTSAINLGVGDETGIDYNRIIGNNIENYFGGRFYYSSNTNKKPVYCGSYEYGISKPGSGVFGVGVSVNYLSYTNNINYPFFLGYGSNYTYKSMYSTVVVGLRATYHPDFCNGKKYDIYGAILLNMYGEISSLTSNNPDYQGYHNRNLQQILPGLIIGARYFFVPNVGVFTEVGFDYTIIKGGLTLKFGGK
jgi:hypothetical protein